MASSVNPKENEFAILQCFSQNYEWGKKGSSSVVATLQASGSNLAIDESKPYAELWMGTHPSCPSRIAGSGLLLRDWLNEDLPYLFKVLSVQKALSIQAHPDKELARSLHLRLPREYKDDNHKPEMALAVRNFQGMCGFRPLNQIVHFIQTVNAFRSAIGESIADEFVKNFLNHGEKDSKNYLKLAFGGLMNQSIETIKAQLKILLQNAPSSSEAPVDETEIEVWSVVKSLARDFPDDVGIFCPFFLNCVSLKAGTALFLGANEPHAYLNGDLIEAMACSDNVVRAGLTPKFRDTQTLLDMLTYKYGKPNIIYGDPLDSYSRIYSPDSNISEFMITSTSVPAGFNYVLKGSKGHSIILVYSGKGSADSEQIVAGTTLLVKEGVSISITASSDLLLYRCSPNAFFSSKL